MTGTDFDRYAPLDDAGRDLRVGDWVRLVKLPDLTGMPPETHDVFARALGKTFRIEWFDRHGLAHLDLTKKVARLHSVFVEPFLLHRTRRGGERRP
jgi:hypothetical protein